MKSLKWIACAAVVAGALAATEKQASADVLIAGDFDVGVPVNLAQTRIPLATGVGFDARLGFRFRIPRAHVAIIPELAAGYTAMDTGIVRVRPGLRLGFGRLVVPYLYGHIGWSWSNFDCGDPTKNSTLCDRQPLRLNEQAERGTGQGAAFDAGLGLDVTLNRHFTIGAHAGYNVVSVTNARKLDAANTNAAIDQPKWFNLGLNASIYF